MTVMKLPKQFVIPLDIDVAKLLIETETLLQQCQNLIASDVNYLKHLESITPERPDYEAILNTSIAALECCILGIKCPFYENGAVVMHPEWITWYSDNKSHASVIVLRLYEVIGRLVIDKETGQMNHGIIQYLQTKVDPGMQVIPVNYHSRDLRVRHMISVEVPFADMSFNYMLGDDHFVLKRLSEKERRRAWPLHYRIRPLGRVFELAKKSEPEEQATVEITEVSSSEEENNA